MTGPGRQASSAADPKSGSRSKDPHGHLAHYRAVDRAEPQSLVELVGAGRVVAVDSQCAVSEPRRLERRERPGDERGGNAALAMRPDHAHLHDPPVAAAGNGLVSGEMAVAA